MGKHQVLKGLTPENKADNYAMVKDRTETEKPTVAQIKAVNKVIKSIETPVEVVMPKPGIKLPLRNDNQLSNLNQTLNWYSNYS